MAGKIKITVKGTREEVAKLRRVPGIVFAEVRDEADVIHKDWIGESQDRTPLLTGALTRSQHPMDVNSLSRIVVRGPKIRLIVGSKLDYAEKMHEDSYRLGKLSEKKMRSTGKLVGRKFIQRALEAKRTQYERDLNEAKDRGIKKAGYGGNR